METNIIIDELNAKAAFDWEPEQKAYFAQQAKDARPVQCVRMRDVFTPDQLLEIPTQSDPLRLF